MTTDEMQKIKTEFGLTYDVIAENSGVPLGTVQKVMSGTTKAPRLETVRRLTAYFEALSAPGKQGEYILDDFLALPDNVRAELIDGTLYPIGSPDTSHQAVSGKILCAITAYIENHSLSCLPFTAPMDVQLDCDDKTIVQPDIFIVCDRAKIGPHFIFGAPDFIVEILSPSTWEKDMFIKGQKYKNAGVREYWLVDPVKKTVLVYRFERDDTVEIHTFAEKVEVGIFPANDPADKLLIDFKDIADYISFIPES